MGILKGKVAVVTGSTSGIGLAYARAFAGAGANVVLNGMGAPAEVEKERSAIESEFGVKAIYSPANMAKPDEIAELITLGENTFGSVDVLVNNAGIQHVAPMVSGRQVECDHWDQPVLRLPRHPCGCAGYEEARLGSDHHHGLGALTCCFALQVSLCRRQA